MPQMAPMSWLMLFMFFSLILILINMMNYYIYKPMPHKSAELMNITMKMNNWKW